MRTPDILRFLLGLKLKKHRFEKGLSLQALSKLSGLSSSYLNEIEKGKKYPKFDKLLLLAKGLKIKIDDLSGQKVDKTWRPLTDFLQSEFFKNFPLETFGMNRGDLYDLMSHNPQKFSSLIATFVGLARHYEMDPQEFSKLALRSFQESKENFFPEIEELADEWCGKLSYTDDGHLEEASLIEVLSEKYDYSIPQTLKQKLPCWPDSGVIFYSGKRPKLLFHEALDRYQRLFHLAKELGFCVLDLTRNDPIEMAFDRGSFIDRQNDLKAFVFACALLWPREVFKKELARLFKKKSFCEETLLSILKKGPFLPEIFIQRMAQIIPQSFGPKNLFYLKVESVPIEQGGPFKVTDEFHLSKLHFPHESRLKQHYCRRWGSLKTLNQWIEEGKTVRPDTTYRGLLKVQKSRVLDSDDVYFCVTLASQRMWDGEFMGAPYSVTLGIAMDQTLKEAVHFLDDPHIPEKKVGQTCETCPIQNCLERVAPSYIYDKKKKREEEEKVLKEFCQRHY